MTQNFSFPDLAAYFATGQLHESFSLSDLTVFASGSDSPKEDIFPELAEVFASGEVNNNAGDQWMFIDVLIWIQSHHVHMGYLSFWC